MSASATPGSRLVDYFFVAGLQDKFILPTYQAVKRGEHVQDDLYFLQQEQAAASDHGQHLKFHPSSGHGNATGGLKRRDTSFGVFDHVQAVIDHFDKERDAVRDTVIAVHDHTRLAEKYNGLQLTDAGQPQRQQQHQHQRQRSQSTHVANQTTTNRTRAYSLQQPSSWHSAPDKVDATTPPFWHQPLGDSTRSQQEDRKPPPVPNILDLVYPPTVLMRYPQQDHAKSPSFPAYAAMFCFPRDISLHYGDQPLPEQVHSFTMTDESGATVNGTCIVYYERLSPDLIEPVDKAIKEHVQGTMSPSTVEYAHHLQGKILYEKEQLERHGSELASLTTMKSTADIQQQREDLEERVRSGCDNLALYIELLEPVKMAVSEAKNIWVPKCVGLLGSMPWIDFYGDWLRVLVDGAVGVRGRKNPRPMQNVESAIYNLIHEVPLPPPGRFEIGMTINQRPLFFSRPPVNHIPLLKNFSLFPIFRALSPHLILAVLETLLSEGKVVFLSQTLGMLSLACESFRYLLFPFYWQFVFIPVLPQRLLTCLQAPVPYIVGFQGDMADIEDAVPEDVCVVNLDSNTMHQYHRAATIPDRQRRKLQASLEQYAPLHTRFRVPYGVPLSVQEAFPNCRMMLACGRSGIQHSFDAPSVISHRKSNSSDLHATWSSTHSSKRRTSGFWSSNTSTKSSNDSSTSLDLPMPSLPQFPDTARLAVDSLTNGSTHNLHTPPMSPKVPTRPQRSSLPARCSPTPTGNESQHAEQLHRPLSYQSTDVKDGRPKRRLSSFMTKPRAVFQSEDIHGVAGSPRIAVSAYATQGHNDYAAPPEMARHVKHIEGHTMAEVLQHEMRAVVGCRCLCGRSVIDDQESQYRQLLLMRCQDCHLVTHDTCTDQIIHPCLPACFDEKKVQESFLRMFASLLYNYRSGFVHDASELGGTMAANRVERFPFFSKDKFLKHSDKDTRAYLSHLVTSQMFNQFITDRLTKSEQEPEILMFDEFIKLKLNRSKLKLVKQDTPFLNDPSFSVSQTIWATPAEDSRPDSEISRSLESIFPRT